MHPKTHTPVPPNESRYLPSRSLICASCSQGNLCWQLQPSSYPATWSCFQCFPVTPIILARLGQDLPPPASALPVPAREYFGATVDSQPQLGDALIRGEGKASTASAEIGMSSYGVTVPSHVVTVHSIALNSALHHSALEGFLQI